MGLLDLFGQGESPFAQWFEPNKGKVTNAFAGLAGSGNDPRAAMQGWVGGLRHGVDVDTENAIIARERAIQDQKIADEKGNQNATVKWLQANYPQYSSLPAAEGFKLALADIEAKQGGGAADAPANIREWEYYNSLTPEQKGEYIRMKRANPYLDIGTGFVQPDPINPGQTAGPTIAKDNFTPAYDSASGTAT